MSVPVVAVLATLDTKVAEARYLAEGIVEAGGTARIVDIGLGETEHPGVVSNREVADRTGNTVAGLRGNARHAAMRAMGDGAGEILREWYGAGALHGVVAVGGNQGTAIASIAMRRLPIGPAKLIISTVASGNVRNYVGDSDIAMQFSVADLLGGPNVVTSKILRRSAAGVVAMAAVTMEPEPVEDAPVVAITAFGNTEPGVVAAMAALGEDITCVPFHASGACGSAMERLIDEGVIDAVLDMTTHEVLGEIEPRDIYAPVRPGRLTAAGRRGLAQVIVPGGLEYFCFGAPETIPPEYRDRPTHIHNPYNTNVRTSADELSRIGAMVAERLNAAAGPAAVLIPMFGWSGVGSPGGVLHDPETNQAYIDSLERNLAATVRLEKHELTINDPSFAVIAAGTLKELMASTN